MLLCFKTSLKTMFMKGPPSRTLDQAFVLMHQSTLSRRRGQPGRWDIRTQIRTSACSYSPPRANANWSNEWPIIHLKKLSESLLKMAKYPHHGQLTAVKFPAYTRPPPLRLNTDRCIVVVLIQKLPYEN